MQGITGTKCIWELNLAALEGREYNNVINIINNKGNWCINEDLTFDNLRACPSLSIPKATPTNYNDLCALVKALWSLSVLIRSSLLAEDCVTDKRDVFFFFPTKKSN